MIKKTALSTLAFVALAGAAASPHAQPVEQVIQPGYWKYETHAMLFLNDVDYRCVRPQDVRKFMAPCNKHNTCTYEVQDAADGQARLEGVWVDNGDGSRAKVRAKGTYSEKKFELRATIRSPKVPIPISGVITATWLSETCPAGARNP